MKPSLSLALLLSGLPACQPATDSIPKAGPPAGAESPGPAPGGNRPPAPPVRPPADTLARLEDVLLLGDAREVPKDNGIAVWVRFKPYVRYSDFRAAPLRKKGLPIRYGSNALAREYRTVITETYRQQGLNFGGHYCLAFWGCGSPCQMSALVDLKTGIVYDGVDAASGYKFKKDSRLLLTNPPDSTGGFYHSGGFIEPKVYVWNEAARKFEQR